MTTRGVTATVSASSSPSRVRGLLFQGSRRSRSRDWDWWNPKSSARVRDHQRVLCVRVQGHALELIAPDEKEQAVGGQRQQETDQQAIAPGIDMEHVHAHRMS
ncbi:MAG: hypothetical protein U5K31_06965 [Balneolaceae bacterium]|nr:hypothetical protein [Balneolaceae bacterium]